ncbi:hypothetical protein BLNAU_24210 [Blattamonas nauphoetae]|uniref:Uncharacterized protein n=1 Tax=Blattamonas nauphoetae TaxID=2049346 RepID=A0ABQ9WN22_9EUKA|nr:hypothetical protein BLNAU_24210 [Blattamonas nauphoetae]
MTSARTQIEPIVEQRMMKTQFEKSQCLRESDTIAFGPEEIDVPDSPRFVTTLHSNSPLDPLLERALSWMAAMECSEGTRECPVSVAASVPPDGQSRAT